ncbi:uncharacterized protein SOCE26_026070 [Sorangium cellulosum]|uniref:Secreted protein n=1 Tax=Sorangium cellulosum TaxID=56 RepID=A0A2L0EPF7_SORCE|nr:hypothetical protein [Sorangium cellulosum]AUX41197.1 uncharacterized protein SOCE26_026070 [Sorangium cellulosum]
MPKISLRHALALALLSASAALAVGCACGDDEDNPAEACDTIFAAVEKVGDGCGSTVTRAAVCGEVCARGGVGECTDHADIDACVGEIKVMTCSDLSARAYVSFGACERIFRLMASSCEETETDSSGGFDDWDD